MTTLDDELADRLRETFQAVAATVEPEADMDRDTDEPVVVPLFLDDEHPAVAEPRRRRTLVAAAVLVAVLGVGGWLGVSLTPDDSTASAPTTTVAVSPTSLVPLPDRASEVAACRTALRRARMQVAVEHRRGPIPRFDETAIVPAAGDPDVRYVIATGGDEVFRCAVDHGPEVTWRPAISTSWTSLTAAEPASDGVIVDMTELQSMTPDDVGPGEGTFTGRIGDRVRGVAIELADGSLQWGSVGDGWFVATAAIPRDEPVGEERLVWVLDDGTERSGRADLLDEETPEERCAATPGCVDERLDELRAEAAAVDATVTIAVLADGVVTDAERGAALQGYVDCLVDAGYDVRRVGARAMTGDGLESLPPGTCAAAHDGAVAEAWSLRDAERRLADP